MKIVVSILALFFTVACSEEIEEPPPAAFPEKLVDCTVGFLDWIEEHRKNDPLRDTRVPQNYVAADLSSIERMAVLDLVTIWAHENSYLPCHYQMCAVLLSGSDEKIKVLIEPEARIEGWIAPSAQVSVSPNDNQIIPVNIAHTGCAHRASLGIEL